MYSAWKISATVVTMVLLLCSCKGTGIPNHPPYRGTGILNYTVYDEQVLDGSKAQVTLKIVIDSSGTETQLRSLLTRLYEETSRRTGFKYHEHPTHICIWAYASTEQAQGGSGWVARLSMMNASDRPEVDINQRLLGAMGEPPPEAFGRSERELMDIWTSIVVTEQEADVAAERKYPTIDYDDTRFIQTIKKRRRFADSLIAKNLRILADSYGITTGQLDSIGTLGAVRGWPIPARH